MAWSELLLWQCEMRQRGSFRNPMATELCICSSLNVWLLEKQRAREGDCRGNGAYLSGWERNSHSEHPQSGQSTTESAARDSSMLTVICAWSRARCRERTVKSPFSRGQAGLRGRKRDWTGGLKNTLCVSALAQ